MANDKFTIYDHYDAQVGLTEFRFLPRDAMHKRGLCGVLLSVCLSVTFVYSVETSKHTFETHYSSFSTPNVMAIFLKWGVE